MNEARPRKRGFVDWTAVAVATGLVYVASSGPVLATAFWLRDRTHWDGFYAMMFVYYPLLFLLDVNNPLAKVIFAYLGWWCRLFGTLPPG